MRQRRVVQGFFGDATEAYYVSFCVCEFDRVVCARHQLEEVSWDRRE